MLTKIKSYLRNNRFTAKMYSNVYSIYWNAQKRKKNHLLKKRGESVIRRIQGLIDGYPGIIFFDMGTLLGFVREGKILTHDLDVDLGIIVNSEEEKDKFRAYLVSNGCKLQYHYYINQLGCVEDSFLLESIKFDINYYQNEGNQSICYLMYREQDSQSEKNKYDVVKLTSPIITNCKRISVYDIEVSIPNNPERYLSNRYGEKWMIPDSNYVYYLGPSAKKTKYIGMRDEY